MKVIFENKTYDITDWLDNHPGGKNILLRFENRDITDEYYAFHNFKPYYILKKSLHTIDDQSTLIQKDFRLLREVFQERGYFKKEEVDIIPFLFFLLFIFLLENLILKAVCLALFWQQIAFIGHDMGHLGKSTKSLIFSNLLTGIGMSWWRNSHNMHHVLPNSLHEDPDIAHLPFLALDSRMCDQYEKHLTCGFFFRGFLAKWIFLPYQKYWFYILMAFSRHNLYVQTCIYLYWEWKKVGKMEKLMQLGFFSWYWLLLLQFEDWPNRFLFHFLTHALAGFLNLQITLSHFSRPINLGTDDFYSRNISATQDIHCLPLWDWLHGGLQFQTTHHLFPTMGRKYLREATPFVVALCQKHDLPYKKVTFMEANRAILAVLEEESNIYWRKNQRKNQTSIGRKEVHKGC